MNACIHLPILLKQEIDWDSWCSSFTPQPWQGKSRRMSVEFAQPQTTAASNTDVEISQGFFSRFMFFACKYGAMEAEWLESKSLQIVSLENVGFTMHVVKQVL